LWIFKYNKKAYYRINYYFVEFKSLVSIISDTFPKLLISYWSQVISSIPDRVTIIRGNKKLSI
jgi:hypothetical protein